MKNLTIALLLLLGVGECYREANTGQSFRWISRPYIGATLSDVAPMEAVVLCNEVQYKYWMRPDLVMRSLDGITDGKVMKSDLFGFIKREHVRYFIPTLLYGKWIDTTALNHLRGDTVLAGISFERREFSFPPRDETVHGIPFTRHEYYYELSYSSMGPDEALVK